MYPLTEEGVSQKKSDLYALSDQQLLLQTKAMCSDFKSWLSNNFDLLPDQQTYLEAIPENVLFGWAAQLTTVLICRGDLEFEFPPYRPQRTKEIKVQGHNSAISYNPENGTSMEASGLAQWEFSD